MVGDGTRGVNTSPIHRAFPCGLRGPVAADLHGPRSAQPAGDLPFAPPLHPAHPHKKLQRRDPAAGTGNFYPPRPPINGIMGATTTDEEHAMTAKSRSLATLALGAALLGGCAAARVPADGNGLTPYPLTKSLQAGDIIHLPTGTAMNFEQAMEMIAAAKVDLHRRDAHQLPGPRGAAARHRGARAALPGQGRHRHGDVPRAAAGGARSLDARRARRAGISQGVEVVRQLGLRLRPLPRHPGRSPATARSTSARSTRRRSSRSSSRWPAPGRCLPRSPARSRKPTSPTPSSAPCSRRSSRVTTAGRSPTPRAAGQNVRQFLPHPDPLGGVDGRADRRLPEEPRRRREEDGRHRGRLPRPPRARGAAQGAAPRRVALRDRAADGALDPRGAARRS